MKKLFVIAGLVIFSASVSAQNNTPTAKAILDVAYKQAAAEKKNVMLMFHASWCGWCHKMDSSLNNPLVKQFFDNNYVIAHLVVYEFDSKKNLENEGAADLLKQYKAFDKGIPFWVVLNAKGDLLQDSFIKNADGTNDIIGCPASEKEVDTFLNILQATSSIKEDELAKIKTVFRKNEAH